MSRTRRAARSSERLFGRAPVAAFPTYAAFTFDNGLHLPVVDQRA